MALTDREKETAILFTCAWQRVDRSHGRVTTELVLKIMRNQVGQARFEMVEFQEVAQ